MRVIGITAERGDPMPRLGVLARSGLRHVLLRERSAPADLYASWARAAARLGLEVWVHAGCSGWREASQHAHGVHFPTYVAPTRCDLPWGTSVHNPSEFREGAAWALIAPVFAPGSKPADSRPTLGIDGYRLLARALPKGVQPIALGGVTHTRVQELAAAGIMQVAVVSDLFGCSDEEAAIRMHRYSSVSE